MQNAEHEARRLEPDRGMMIIDLCNDTNSLYRRQVAAGVQAYALGTEDVQIRYRLSKIIRQTAPVDIDGAISIDPQALLDFKKQGVPCINASSIVVRGIPQVCIDNTAVCQLIFDHFHARNFQTLAILVDDEFEALKGRVRAFKRICEAHGHTLYPIEYHGAQELSLDNRALVKKLRTLPRPTGMMLIQDFQAPPLFRICRELDIRVPQDLAVVGVNNASFPASSETPILSSVDINPERIGYLAADLLVRMIKGEKIPRITRVPPRELILRKSSDITIQLNPNLTRALAFMRSNLDEKDLEFGDIICSQELGRRALEKQFLSQFNEPPMKHLRSLRLEKARLLLESTDLKVTEIGRQCGFKDTNYLCRLFRNLHHATPLEFRRQKRSSR